MLAASLVALAVIIPGVPAAAAPGPGGESRWKATPLTGTVVNGAKSASGRLAKSDPKVFGLRSAAPVRVMVKLDYDAYASYRGGLAGLPATSPAVTRRTLDPRSADARKYAAHIGQVETGFLRALRGRIPDARPGPARRVVFGGLSVTVPGNKVAELARLPGVAAVQRDAMLKPLTDSSASFIGAQKIYDRLGGRDNAGRGVVVGVLDTGSWPEHPSYQDPGTLPAPPPTADGTPRPCTFGDNPQTPAADPFVCNRKLISGQPFLEAYNEIAGDEPFPDSARDSDGHGSHTSTTSAGRPTASANPLGIDRGPIAGLAPGAGVAVYKVCGPQGCVSSDSMAAVERAILDKVRVINYSISGGADPYRDSVELAFLDAYAAGVLVSASAGNEGPGAGTVNHRGPWVTTVAASSQTRTFQSTVRLSGGGATATISGASITSGVSTPAPVVLASAPPYGNALCDTPAPAGTFTGKIVACERGPNRALKGRNVLQGGAVGMLLYNSTLAETMTDNHFLPVVHLEKPQGDTLLSFLAAHPNATATFTQGAKANGQGDVMTAFSSRGPGGDFLKPDVTAPGLQILAGNSPVAPLSPPGNLYQAIAGTSMSAPHVTGAAALLFAQHPSWTPGQVKSALMTTATQSVVKHDRTTQADPFDFGAGRIDLNRAGDPGLTFDETGARYAASATDPLDRIDLNVPSINATTMPGATFATRVARNASRLTLSYEATPVGPSDATITITPSTFTLAPGETQSLRIQINAPSLANGQYFGAIRLNQVGGPRDLRLPVAFFKQQGEVTMDQTCSPTTIALSGGRSTCRVQMQNNALRDARIDATSKLSESLLLTQVSGATQVDQHTVTAQPTLAARKPDAPAIAPGASPGGYVPLDELGVDPVAMDDEDAINLNTPEYRFAGGTHTQLGVVSNGYSVTGVAQADDIVFEPQTLPDAVRPNGVMAPFWTDLDGAGAPGVFAAILTDNTTGNEWIVIEWRMNIFGTSSGRVFQQWIGLNGTEDVSFTYDPANLPAAPPEGFGLTVGAENTDGTAGDQIDGTPTQDLRVTTTPGAAGGSFAYAFVMRGTRVATGTVTTSVITPVVRGITKDNNRIIVR